MVRVFTSLYAYSTIFVSKKIQIRSRSTYSLQAATRQLSRLHLDPDIQSRLSSRSIHTAKDIFSKTTLDLSELLDLSIDQAAKLLQEVATHILPHPTTAYELYKQSTSTPRYLRTLLPPLDSALLGGLQAGGITELVGPAGLGKTQFCLGMCIVGCLDRLSEEGRVLYIDTERKFSGERLAQIARSRFPDNFAIPESMATMLDRVLIKSPETSKELLDLLQGLQSAIIDHGIKLVIIDSIAALARTEYGSKNIIERQQLLGKQASSLKYLAEAFQIPVLVTNQVTTRILPVAATTSTMGLGDQQYQENSRTGGHLMAALGPMWAHAVNTRLVMSAERDEDNDEQVRVLTIAKSPVAPRVSMVYGVSSAGVEWMENVPLPRGVGEAGGSVVDLIIGNYQKYHD